VKKSIENCNNFHRESVRRREGEGERERVALINRTQPFNGIGYRKRGAKGRKG